MTRYIAQCRTREIESVEINCIYATISRREKKNEFVKMQRETTTRGDSRYFPETLERREHSYDIYFYPGQLFSNGGRGKIPKWKGAKFLKRLISNGREGEIRLLSVDYFYTSGRTIFARNGRASPRIAHRLACMERRTESLEARTNIEKHRGSTKGEAGYFKAWLRASITGPNTRRSYFQGDSSTSPRRGEIVSFSPCCTGRALN